MSILIISATSTEIAPFLEKYPSADFLISGVGSSVAMFQLVDRLHQKQYDFLLQVGVGGIYADDLKLGEAVYVAKDCFADVGVFENGQFNSVFDIGLADKNQFPFKDGWLLNELEVPVHFKKASGVTVNYLTTDFQHIHLLQQKYNASVESMEGAVLHYVALQKNISFLQIRGISNRVGERDKSKWKMKEAIESSNKMLIEIYENYTNSKKRNENKDCIFSLS